MAVCRASEPKPFTWESIEIGEEMGPVDGIISDLQIKAYAYAVDDYGSWYLRESPFGGRIGHPLLLTNDILRLFLLIYDVRPDYPAGLHARSEVELLRPVSLGQHVTVRGRHVDKFQKRGQDYRITEGEAVDDANRPLIRMRAWETVGLQASSVVGQGRSSPRADAITGVMPAGAELVTRADRHTPLGAGLPSLQKQTSLEQSIAFSGFPFGWAEGGAKAMRPGIHTDPENARRRGQSDAIIQGMMTVAYLSELCTGFFGPAWLTTGRLSASFIKPVIVRDEVVVSGMVKRLEEQENVTRMYLDVWMRNQRGELVAVGHASALVE